MREERNDGLINGAMIALGAIGVIDNTLFHWLLNLHRVVPGTSAVWIEAALVILSAVLLIAGIWREIRARRGA